jgi:hypothetical protein
MPLPQAVQLPAGQPPAFACEHGAVCHDGTEPAVGTAPEAARSWLLIEHDGPWPAEAADAALPGRLADLAAAAEETGIRLQLIRRPGRRPPRPASGVAGTGGATESNGAAPAPRRYAAGTPDAADGTAGGTPPVVYVAWTAGPSPWLRRGDAAAAGALRAQLAGLPDGAVPSFGQPVTEPLYLVCAHGRRDVCCARFGAPLARALGPRSPRVWETTHVGGHRYAANLVILPHGLYYGPVDETAAGAAVDAYQRGEIAPGRYRGRAGQPRAEQEARYQRMVAAGTFALGELG